MHHHSSKYIFPQLYNQRTLEEYELPQGSFTGRIAKGSKYSLLIGSIIMLGIGFLSFGSELSILFFIASLLISALLPTYFSYRCYVDKRTLKVTFFILCFKVTKEIQWNNIAYKKVKRDKIGNPYSICLYNVDKKKVAYFDAIIVGFDRIVKIAKPIPKLRKLH